MSQRWKRSAFSNRRLDGRLSAEQVEKLRETGVKFKTNCKNGKECPHGENCIFANCQTKTPCVQDLEKQLGRTARVAIILLEQRGARDEIIAELTAEIKALRAKVRAETKSPSKKRGKKSSGAGAGDAVVDDMNFLSLAEFNEIILDILSDKRDERRSEFMTCAEIGLAFMKHDKNPSEHRLTTMFQHLRKNKKIAGYFTSATKYIASLENVVEGSKRGILKTFGFSVEEEVALGALLESDLPPTLDDEWQVADVSLGSRLEPVAPSVPAALSAPAAPVLKPKDSVLDVPPIAGIKSDGN